MSVAGKTAAGLVATLMQETVIHSEEKLEEAWVVD